MATKFNVTERHNKFRWLKIPVQLRMDKTIVKGKNCVGKFITIQSSVQ